MISAQALVNHASNQCKLRLALLVKSSLSWASLGCGTRGPGKTKASERDHHVQCYKEDQERRRCQLNQRVLALLNF